MNHATEDRHVADPPPYPDPSGDTGAGPGRGSSDGTPRWVFVVGIVIAVGLLLLIVVLHLTGTISPGVH